MNMMRLSVSSLGTVAAFPPRHILIKKSAVLNFSTTFPLGQTSLNTEQPHATDPVWILSVELVFNNSNVKWLRLSPGVSFALLSCPFLSWLAYLSKLGGLSSSDSQRTRGLWDTKEEIWMLPFQAPQKPVKLSEVLLLNLLMPAPQKVPLGSKGI